MSTGSHSLQSTFSIVEHEHQLRHERWLDLVRKSGSSVLDDTKLVERALKHLANEIECSAHVSTRPLWSRVMESFGVGSTLAKGLCDRFNLNPEAR